MNQTELRSIELALRALLLQIQALGENRLRRAYEKLTEAQDDVHTLLRKEWSNEWEKKP